MNDGPEYRKLLEKHGLAIGMIQSECMTKEQVSDKNHQVEAAILEIERKEMQCQRGAKEGQLNNMMRKLMFERMEVVEVYGPPRIFAMASQMGLRAGWSLDLSTYDERGQPWDFNQTQMRDAAVRKVLQDKPMFLIGSPMCGPFSTMNNINYARVSEEEKNQRIADGREHLEFCIQLYELQWREGRYFLHEHPDSASSWKDACVTNMLKRQGVVRGIGDQCQYGLKSHDGCREGPARKRIGFMTNSPCIARKFSRKCPNTREYTVHDHVVLSNGRAKAAQVYPFALCRAVCSESIEQMEADKKGQFLLASVDVNEKLDTKQMMEEAENIKTKYKTIEEDNDDTLEIAWDDVSGAELDPKVVRRASGEEIWYVRKLNVYTKVPIQECYMKIGKTPITVRWVDINKGDAANPHYRPRLVAR